MTFDTKNKSISLPELIIVIAILAALAAIICIQVIPPLERAKEARDRQLVERFLTAAKEASSCSQNRQEEGKKTVVDVYTGSYPAGTAEAILQEEIRELMEYDTIEAVRSAALSNRGRRITDIRITVDSIAKTIKVRACDGAEQVFEEAESVF